MEEALRWQELRLPIIIPTTLCDYLRGELPFGIPDGKQLSVSRMGHLKNAVVSCDLETTFELPMPGDSTWNQFLTNGAKKTVDFRGLRSTIQIVGGVGNDQYGNSYGNLQWGSFSNPYLITHRASSSNYFFVIEYKGYVLINGHTQAQVVSPASQDEFCPLYSLDFNVLPSWRSSFIQSPHFDGEAVPSWYYGKSLQELQAQWGYEPIDPLPAMQNSLSALAVDQSAELRSHPELDKLVERLGGNPIALSNYVFNEVALSDPIGYSDVGDFNSSSINVGGLSRSALGTYLEGRGNPWEQCALLVYLLRKAGVPAIYCEPESNKLGLLDTQLSKLLRMQIRGAQMPEGQTPMPEIVSVNYPWVVAWIASENRWVHLFPWLKDTEIIERGNIFDQFPANCKTGLQWVKKYLNNDADVVPEQIAAYQQDSGADKLVVIEAEGYHENVTYEGKKWEPLEDGGPVGYSGLGWMKVRSISALAMSAPNAPRLDFKVDFATSGIHYVFVRSCSESASIHAAVHIGIDGQVAATADNVKAGDTFQWYNTDYPTSTVLTVNVPSAGRHTVSVWAANRNVRFDKILLTTSPSYYPSAEPSISKQSSVDPNIPSNLFTKYSQTYLPTDSSLSDYGVSYRDRHHERISWDEFPKPFQLITGVNQFYTSLSDRANTFDTIRVQAWSDRNGDGIYNGPSVDSSYLDTGNWMAADLQNRRFYIAARKTGTDSHQLRLVLAPYRISATGVEDFTSSNKLSEQLRTANLTSADDKIQLEITRTTQRRVTKYGVHSVDIINGGSGYLFPPTVTVAPPPAGDGHRNATAIAEVTAGKVSAIKIQDPGYGYNSVPTVTLFGGLFGSGALATAIMENAILNWRHPLGISVDQIITEKPAIKKGDLAAICLNYGSVSDRMVRLQALDFWSSEREMQTDATKANNPEFLEKTRAISCYLMGLSYYNKIGKFGEYLERLNKVHVLGMYSAGLSKLIPYRDVSGALPNSGDIIPTMAAVDMTVLMASYASNGSIHPDSGLLFNEATESFWPMYIAEISAQEHNIINEYFGESAAISTIKLLQRATLLPSGIRRLTKENYVAEGNINYSFGGLTKLLKNWDSNMWAAITSAFQGNEADYSEVFITPGPITSASASYSGVGAMVLTRGAASAPDIWEYGTCEWWL